MTERRYELKVSDGQGQTQVHRLGEGETIVGSHASADICLTNEPALLPRHILLSPRQNDCWVSATGTLLRDERGCAIEACFLPWGSRLRLGTSHFQLQIAANAPNIGLPEKLGNSQGAALDTGGEGRTTPGGVHPLVIMLLLSTIAIVGMSFLASSKTEASARLSDQVVELFAEAPSCTSTHALHRAETAAHAADAKSARAVFEVQDGIAAVSLYQEASSCYQQVGQLAQASAMREEARKLRGALQGEYRRLFLRLERALADGDSATASRQVQRLRSFLQHQQQSPTSHALRRLALRLSRKN